MKLRFKNSFCKTIFYLKILLSTAFNAMLREALNLKHCCIWVNLVFSGNFLCLCYMRKPKNACGIQFLSNITHKSYQLEEFILEASLIRLRTQLHKVFPCRSVFYSYLYSWTGDILNSTTYFTGIKIEWVLLFVDFTFFQQSKITVLFSKLVYWLSFKIDYQ